MQSFLRNQIGQLIMFLLEAVKNNDIAKIRELVVREINQNEGAWALHYAVAQGSLEIVRILIHANIDVNRERLMGHPENLILVEGTALLDAAYEGSLNIIEELLKAGANVNYLPRFSNDPSALILATREGHFEIVKRLVEAGANVNFVRDGEDYALFSAASHGYEEIFDFLYPLTAEELRSEALKALPKGIQMKKIEEEADPLVCQLTDFIAENDIGNVQSILAMGIDINSYEEFGFTPLLCAVAIRSVSLVRMLLEVGANPDKKSVEDETTPLIASTISIWSEEEVAITSLLLEAGCNVNAQDIEGYTALMYAVQCVPRDNEARLARLKSIQLLLQFGADINIKNLKNQNAFEVVRNESSEVLNLLNSV